MNCQHFDSQLLDLARGTPAAADGAAVLDHARECPSCAARLRRERVVTARLHALREATANAGPSRALETRLMEEFAGRRSEADASREAAAGFALEERRTARRVVTVLVQNRQGRLLLAAAAAALVTGGAAMWLGLQPTAGAGLPATREGVHRLAAEPLAAIAAPPSAEPAVGGLTERALGGRAKPGRELQTTRATHGSPGPATGGPPGGAETEFLEWPGAASLPAFESGQLVRTELPASVLPLLGITQVEAGERRTVSADVIVGQDGLARAVRLVR